MDGFPSRLQTLIKLSNLPPAQMRADDLDHVVRHVLRAGFFALPDFDLLLRHEPARSVAWDLVGGHLLDEAQTRSRAAFDSWEVLLLRGDDPAAAQPLIAVLLAQPGTLYVIRYLRVRGWEAYEAEPNVIQSRPVEKWAREVVGTILVGDAAGEEELAARLARLVFQGFVGTRLPVTSSAARMTSRTL